MKIIIDTHTFLWFINDRLLIAQSIVEDLLIASIDKAFDAYGVNRIW